MSVVLAGTFFVFGALLIVPIFFLIAQMQEVQRQTTHRRLVQMHRIWTEIASSVGAPVRDGYRSRSERASIRARIEVPGELGEVAELPDEVVADDRRIGRD